MKKIIFSLAIVATAGLSIMCLYKTEYGRQSLDSVSLANIEALSHTEDSGYMYVTPVEYPWGWGCNCAGKGSEKCC